MPLRMVPLLLEVGMAEQQIAEMVAMVVPVAAVVVAVAVEAERRQMATVEVVQTCSQQQRRIV